MGSRRGPDGVQWRDPDGGVHVLYEPINKLWSLSYVFVKKIPLSQRVEYVVDGSMDQ